MSRSVPTSESVATSDRTRVEHMLQRAAVAAVLSDLRVIDELANTSDAELGRRFKARLAQVIGIATMLNIDSHSMRKGDARQLNEFEGRAKRRRSAQSVLVSEGKLLRAPIFCQALGITERKLAGDVASGRIFSVDLHDNQFYPAFFVTKELERRDLTKVVRVLNGLTGWKKWNFFTKPNSSLGKLTPLQALFNGDVKQVLHAATTFVER
jgi:hypothetical protein